MKGLRVSIMGDDCTNNGVTSGKHVATIVGKQMRCDGPFEADDDAPAMVLVLDYGNPSEINADLATVRAAIGGEDTKAGRALDRINQQCQPRIALAKGRELVDKHGRIARVYAVPEGHGRGGMFGGHWLISSDSRFPFEAPIPVFDRYE